MYRAAYPNKGLDGKDLRRQLLKTIPALAAESLEKDLTLVRNASGRQNTWKTVLSLLEAQDEASRRYSSRMSRVSTPSQRSPWSGAQANFLAMGIQQQKPHPLSTGKQISQKPGQRQRFPSNGQNHHARPRQPSKSPHPRSRTQSRDPASGNSAEPPSCSWCGQPWHHYDVCRRRLGLCLRCGSNRHRVYECPEPVKKMVSPSSTQVAVKQTQKVATSRRSSSSSNSSSPQRRRSRNSSGSRGESTSHQSQSQQRRSRHRRHSQTSYRTRGSTSHDPNPLNGQSPV